MATRGRISIGPISRIVLHTFVNIYAKFGAFITNGNDSLFSQCLAAPLKGIHRTFRDKPQFNSRFVLVPLEIAPDLNHSRRVVTDRAGVPMVPKGLETTIYTDASLLGWGGIMGQNKARGVHEPS